MKRAGSGCGLYEVAVGAWGRCWLLRPTNCIAEFGLRALQHLQIKRLWIFRVLGIYGVTVVVCCFRTTGPKHEMS